jgi:fructose-1,6-bisphosphatase I
MRLEETLMHFLLEHQERRKGTYNFLLLMEAIFSAAKYIQHYYRTGALAGNLGSTGRVNVQGETVMRMDQIAHTIVHHYVQLSGQVIHAISEEEEDLMILNEKGGRYFIYFDPLDGSSNVKHGLDVGFMFGIGKRNLEGPEDYHLRKGVEFIASGMVVIPTGIFTIALRESGCFRFYLDETLNYVRPQQVELPESPRGWELSFNASNVNTFDDKVEEWLRRNENKYSFRYMGSLAGDFHRLLTNGGMFLYPAIVNHPNPDKNRPKGKLRLLYEANVVAFMCREAGGAAIDENGDDILEVTPLSLHQRTALYVGSKPLVHDIRKILKA